MAEGTELINLNNAGSSRPWRGALEAEFAHLQLEDSVGGYEAAIRRTAEMKSVYTALATLLHCDSDEVAYMDSATRAWNVFLYSLPLKPGDVILTSATEFGTNLVSLAQVAARRGARITLVGSQTDGTTDLDDLERKLGANVALVALSHVPAHRGLENPVDQIGRLIRAKSQALFLLDACQAAGQIPLDVKAIGCHACTGTGRKWLRAPRGTGFLYVDRDTANAIDPLTVDLATATLGPDIERSPQVNVIEGARRFETWERNIAAFLGLGEAVRQTVSQGLEATHATIGHHATVIREGLRERGYSTAEPTSSPVGIVSIPLDDATATGIKQAATTAGIAISVMHPYDAPLDFAAMQTPTVVRISPHSYNSEDEIQALLSAIPSRHSAV